MDLSTLIIRRASAADVKCLTGISWKAFDDDARRFMNGQGGGPPGYRSEKANSKMVRSCDYYVVSLPDYTAVGGIILSPEGDRCYLARMFVLPDYQNQGIGAYIISSMEKAYPGVRTWHLDTPAENARTNHFYVKCGYRLQQTKDGFNFYEKTV